MISQAPDGFARSHTCRPGLTPRRPASRSVPPAGVAQERSASPEVGLPSPLTHDVRFRCEEMALSGKRRRHDPVVIAIDPHKASWTAAAVDAALHPWPRSGCRSAATATAAAPFRRPLARPRYGPSRAPAGWAPRWPAGCPPTGSRVDVPAKLATRVRMLSTGHGRKNDDADAISVGIAALQRRRAAAPPSSTTPSPRCAPWSSTATTWSTPAPRRSTGCTCCSPSCSPAAPPGPRRRHRRPAAAPDPAPRRSAAAPCAGSPPSSSPRSATSTDASPPRPPNHRRRRTPAEPP